MPDGDLALDIARDQTVDVLVAQALSMVRKDQAGLLAEANDLIGIVQHPLAFIIGDAVAKVLVLIGLQDVLDLDFFFLRGPLVCEVADTTITSLSFSAGLGLPQLPRARIANACRSVLDPFGRGFKPLRLVAGMIRVLTQGIFGVPENALVVRLCSHEIERVVFLLLRQLDLGHDRTDLADAFRHGPKHGLTRVLALP